MRKMVIGRVENGTGTGAREAAAISSSSTTPPARVRVSHVHRRGLASLRSNGTDQPYWRDGNLAQSWSNEDDPDTRTLFYTAADLYQDPTTGDIFYDGEDDQAAIGAFEGLKTLFQKKQAPAGVAPPNQLKRGTGGAGAKPLAPQLGVETRWGKHELAPGIQLRIRKGVKVAVANTGTADAPIWTITPGVRNAAGGFSGVGVIPLIALVIKGGAALAGKRAAHQATAAHAAVPPESTTHVQLAPGQSVEIGRGDVSPQVWNAWRRQGMPAAAWGVAGFDSVGSVVGEPLTDAVSSGLDDDDTGDVLTGALLIDSDGRKIRI